MDNIIKIKFELAKFRGTTIDSEEGLRGMGVTSDIKNILLEDGFLEYEPHCKRYRIMDSRDMIIAKETWKAGEETKKLTKVIIQYTFILILLATMPIIQSEAEKTDAITASVIHFVLLIALMGALVFSLVTYVLIISVDSIKQFLKSKKIR